MDTKTIIEIVSLVIIILGAGAAWQQVKSAIVEERHNREAEILRLEAIATRDRDDSRGRADTSKTLIIQAESRLSTMLESFAKSREAHDKDTSALLTALTTSVQSLNLVVGELKGIVNTFIDEYRSGKKA